VKKKEREINIFTSLEEELTITAAPEKGRDYLECPCISAGKVHAARL